MSHRGWHLVVGGFCLLLFASLLDITDNFVSLNRFVVVGDTEIQTLLENLVGYLGGSIVLTIGLVQWIPTVASYHRLQQNERKFQAITQNTTDITAIIDQEGVCRYVSPSIHEIGGYLVDEVVNQRPECFVHPDDLPWVEEVLARALEHPNESRHLDNFRVRHSDGHYLWLEGSLVGLPDVPGVNGVVLTCRDITERERMEQDLRDTAAALAAANRALGQVGEAADRAKREFMSNISHEIRTPLTAILGFCESLVGNLDTEEDRAAATTIKRNGEYLLRLINDILDLSKMEAGLFEVERRECSPAKAVADVVSLMQVRAELKNLSLEIEYVGAIPKTIRCDPIRLRQILFNLVGNAIKFTEAGTVRVVIRLVKSSSRPPMVQFDVIDTGIGMTQKQVSKLFRPFVQGNSSTTRKYGGTGLGLAISKRLAGILAGDITISSSPGNGSTFSLTVETGPLDGVPMLEDPTEVTAESTQRATSPAARDAILDSRILLVEDAPDNQRLISLVLKKAGAEVAMAENGQIAFEKASAAKDEANPFAVILMDIQMPVMDGYEATRQLRQAGYTGPIIALTAHALAGDDERCREAGCDDYMAKPIDREKLLTTIAKHINKSQQQAILVSVNETLNGRMEE